MKKCSRKNNETVFGFVLVECYSSHRLTCKTSSRCATTIKGKSLALSSKAQTPIKLTSDSFDICDAAEGCFAYIREVLRAE